MSSPLCSPNPIDSQPQLDQPTVRPPLSPQIDLQTSSSQQLFIALGTEFGFHNIVPIPNWLRDTNDDRAQKQWLKSGPNAFLYFLHKTPKHRARLEKIANVPLLCACKPCLVSKMGKSTPQYAESHLCGVFCCDSLPYLLIPIPCCWVYYCCICHQAEDHYLRFHANDGTHDELSPYGTDRQFNVECCGGKTHGAVEFRHELLTTLQTSGVRIEIPSKGKIWWQFACCTPCLNTHSEAILHYYFYKRYGFNLELKDGPNKVEEHIFGRSYSQWRSELTSHVASVQFELDDNIYNKFVKRSRENNPFDGTSESNDPDAPATGKKFLCGPFPSYPMFTEWTNFDKAVEYHNKLWGNTHKLTFLKQRDVSISISSKVEMD